MIKRKFVKKKILIDDAKKIVEENKKLFGLENKRVKVSFRRDDINNAAIRKTLFGRYKYKIDIYKLDNEFYKGLKLLLGHELSHAKYLEDVDNKEYLRLLKEFAGFSLGLGKYMKKEALVKKMLLEVLCDINSINTLGANEKEIEAFYNRREENRFKDRVYVNGGYLPPEDRNNIVKHFALKGKINKIEFSKYFMDKYNLVIERVGYLNFKLESTELILKILENEIKGTSTNFENLERRNEVKIFKTFKF